ncbi:thymidylate synthase [Candidatus Falkowbacteria bacterium]|nr:thymidylate synthase [Candidatus Falkowbacteria bacterium]
MTQFDKQYKQAIWEIMNQGYEEYNERTGHKTKIVPGITFHLDDGFPLLTLRKIPIKVFVAEQIWFLTGSNRPDEFLRKHTKIWDNFTEEDGTVAAAYGYRWRRHFGRDQIEHLVKHLKEQPGSRHAVVVMWDPTDDGLGSGTKKKNVPCPYTFTVNIIGNKLHLHVIIRSNDMIFGCPHDAAGFAILQYLLAAKLEVKPGRLTYSVSNAHVYDIHYQAAWEILERKNNHPRITLEPQKDWFDRAEKADDALVEEIVNKLSKQYNPLAPIKGLQIVL